MYRGLSVIAIVPVFNEEAKIGEVVGACHDKSWMKFWSWMMVPQTIQPK